MSAFNSKGWSNAKRAALAQVAVDAYAAALSPNGAREEYAIELADLLSDLMHLTTAKNQSADESEHADWSEQVEAAELNYEEESCQNCFVGDTCTDSGFYRCDDGYCLACCTEQCGDEHADERLSFSGDEIGVVHE